MLKSKINILAILAHKEKYFFENLFFFMKKLFLNVIKIPIFFTKLKIQYKIKEKIPLIS